MQFVYIILSLVMIIAGAHFLVEGSTSVAKRFNMSEFLIGLTIVSIGTSMPEMVVSLFGTLDGKGDIAIGNVLGSNLANILLILGVTALVRPVIMDKSTLKYDIPFSLFTAMVMFFFCFEFSFMGDNPHGVITRLEGMVLLTLLMGFMVYSFANSAKQNKALKIEAEAAGCKEEEQPAKKLQPIWLSAIYILGGLAMLVFGGRLFVSNGTAIALRLGVSESVIAITLMAIGTSLPELATSVVAAAKGNTQLALGNIIGSNTFNICFILGICSLVRPIETGNITVLDAAAPIGATIVLLLSALTFKRRTIDRRDGLIFLALYIGYIYLLVK